MDKNYICRLEHFLRGKLSKIDLTLTRLPIGCAAWVFRADPGPFFVKACPIQYAEGARDAIACLNEFRDMPFVSRSIVDGPLFFEETVVMVQSWQEGQNILVPLLSNAQIESLVSAYKSLQTRLCSGKFKLAKTRDPEVFYEQIVGAINRNGIFGRILSYIKDIPYEARVYGDKVVIHGDFQYRNFGFTGDKLSAFFDLETLRLGSPVEDLLYLITDCYRKKGLSPSKRRRVEEILKLVIRLYGYPREEWMRALNILRLRVVAKRVSKHGWNPIVMIDAYQRDKPFRRLANIINAEVIV